MCIFGPIRVCLLSQSYLLWSTHKCVYYIYTMPLFFHLYNTHTYEEGEVAAVFNYNSSLSHRRFWFFIQPSQWKSLIYFSGINTSPMSDTVFANNCTIFFRVNTSLLKNLPLSLHFLAIGVTTNYILKIQKWYPS